MKMLFKPFFLLFFLISFVSATDESVSVKAEKEGAYVIVKGVNKNPFYVTVYYSASYKNLRSNKKLPLLFVLAPMSQVKVLKLKIIKNDFRYKAHYNWTIGSKDAKHDDGYIYRLPYEKGTSQMVSQGFNGKFSHYGKSRYAVDFNMKEGTGVYAAREGRVVKVKSDSYQGGANRKFEEKSNYIIIEHSDKTLATYAHLQHNGVLVKVGQKVQRGELIGYSGKTGYARGAHLHFVVYKATDGRGRKSIPVKFKSISGTIINPIVGRWYQAAE